MLVVVRSKRRGVRSVRSVRRSVRSMRRSMRSMRRSTRSVRRSTRSVRRSTRSVRRSMRSVRRSKECEEEREECEEHEAREEKKREEKREERREEKCVTSSTAFSPFLLALSPHHPPHRLLMCNPLYLLCQMPKGAFSIGTFCGLEGTILLLSEETIGFSHARLCLDMAEKGHHAQEECVFDGCHERVSRCQRCNLSDGKRITRDGWEEIAEAAKVGRCRVGGR